MRSRAEVVELIRNHLANELELDPAEIAETTRFREDLAIDSLDLLALAQELEDRLGVKVPEDQAADLKTVGDVADFVIAQAG
jgi:acyl carrier protein